MRTLLLAASLSIAIASSAAAQPPGTLDAAIGLYEQAAYADALGVLDGLPRVNPALPEQVTTEHYRMLCLLALNRPLEAEATMRALLEVHPAYRAEGDLSPRLQRLFEDVRRRVVPEIIRRRYALAKSHYEARRFDDAVATFTVVLEIGAQTASDLKDPALADLMDVARGFRDLAAASLEKMRLEAAAAAAAAAPPPPLAAIPPPLVPTATPVLEGSTTAAATPVPSSPAALTADADTVFDGSSAGVTAAIPLSQRIEWRSRVPQPRDGTNLGTIEVVVDEMGAVVSARPVTSISAFYDVILLESAKAWRFRPAMRDGRPVKFRRSATVVAGH